MRKVVVRNYFLGGSNPHSNEDLSSSVKWLPSIVIDNRSIVVCLVCTCDVSDVELREVKTAFSCRYKGILCKPKLF